MHHRFGLSIPNTDSWAGWVDLKIILTLLQIEVCSYVLTYIYKLKGNSNPCRKLAFWACLPHRLNYGIFWNLLEYFGIFWILWNFELMPAHASSSKLWSSGYALKILKLELTRSYWELKIYLLALRGALGLEYLEPCLNFRAFLTKNLLKKT